MTASAAPPGARAGGYRDAVLLSGRSPRGARGPAGRPSRHHHRVAVPDPALPHRPRHPVDAVVVGGGLAGFAAATVLAERGVHVDVLEAAPQVGGRLAAWPHRLPDGTTHTVEHGFHAFFRQYYNLRALLRRVDPGLETLRAVPDYQIEARDWPVESFAHLPAALPWNLVALCLRSPSLSLRDLRRMDGTAALPLLSYDPVRTYAEYDTTSAAELLDRTGFPDRARALLFDVFAHSFFNLEAELSAAEMIMLFHFYFLGNPEGLLFDAVDEDYASSVWRPLTDRIEARGGTVRTGTAVTAVEPAGGSDGLRWTVLAADGTRVTTSHVVLALDVAALRRLVDASPGLRALAPVLAEQVDSLRTTSPYAVSRLWLRGDVRPERCAFTSVSREPTLDSVTLYHRLEREPMRWAAATGGSVVELHAYAAPRGVPADDLHARMRAEWAGLWDEVGALPVLAEDVRVGADAPAFGLGSAAHRPGVTTDAPGIRLAGDGIALPFPSALMERAVASGLLAANDVLAAEGVAAEPVVSIRPRGLLAGSGLADAARARVSAARAAAGTSAGR